jgi:hypothetical protein
MATTNAVIWIPCNASGQFAASGATVNAVDDTLLGLLYDFNFDTVQANDGGGCQFAPSKGWDSWKCLAIDMATDAEGQKKIAELALAK